jgi:hypothetical protein
MHSRGNQAAGVVAPFRVFLGRGRPLCLPLQSRPMVVIRVGLVYVTEFMKQSTKCSAAVLVFLLD